MMNDPQRSSDIESTRPSGNTIIEVRDLYKRFGDTMVLKGVSLHVEQGQSVVVMGASGSGKSVLLKHLVHLLEPDRGEVWVNGLRVDQIGGEALDRLRLSMGFLFQGGALFDSMSVYENMSFLLERHTRLNKTEIDDRIAEALQWVDLDGRQGRYPSELSGGQKTRVALARAMVLQPQIILYDEPTTGLDPISVRMVAGLIERLQREQGITSVTITHDLACAEIVAGTVYFLHAGQFVAHGTLTDVRQSKHPAIQAFFGG